MSTVQVRKAAEERVRDIVAATEAAIRDSGTIPHSMSEVAKIAGVKRTLVYLYFAEPAALIDAIANKQLLSVEEALFPPGKKPPTDRKSLADLGCAYQRYLISEGPVLRYIMRDVGRGIELSPETLSIRNRIVRALARLGRSVLDLSVHDALTLIELLSAMPEELANGVRRGDIDPSAADRTTHRLVLASLDAVRSVD